MGMIGFITFDKELANRRGAAEAEELFLVAVRGHEDNNRM
jgi:hypothetical protein